MQVNDLVKVIAPGHEFEGQAGIINDSADGVNTVKLDLVEEPQAMADDELIFLGR